MAEKKVGALIKEARTEAGLTQEKLAKKAGSGLDAAMISECERGKADLTNTQLKKIAVACGVTQSSLLNAPKNLKTSEKKTTTEKTSTSKTAAAKKTTAKTAAKTTAKTAAKTSSASKTSATASSVKVTAAEKKLLEAYREASADLKKVALKILKGEYSEEKIKQLDSSSGSVADGLGDVLGDVLSGILGGK